MTLPRLILPDSEQETVAAGVLGVGLWRRLVATLKLLGGGSRKQVIEHDGYEVMVEATHQHGQDSGRVRVEGGGYASFIHLPDVTPYKKLMIERSMRPTSGNVAGFFSTGTYPNHQYYDLVTRLVVGTTGEVLAEVVTRMDQTIDGRLYDVFCFMYEDWYFDDFYLEGFGLVFQNIKSLASAGPENSYRRADLNLIPGSFRYANWTYAYPSDPAYSSSDTEWNGGTTKIAVPLREDVFYNFNYAVLFRNSLSELYANDWMGDAGYHLWPEDMSEQRGENFHEVTLLYERAASSYYGYAGNLATTSVVGRVEWESSVADEKVYGKGLTLDQVTYSDFPTRTTFNKQKGLPCASPLIKLLNGKATVLRKTEDAVGEGVVIKSNVSWRTPFEHSAFDEMAGATSPVGNANLAAGDLVDVRTSIGPVRDLRRKQGVTATKVVLDQLRDGSAPAKWLDTCREYLYDNYVDRAKYELAQGSTEWDYSVAVAEYGPRYSTPVSSVPAYEWIKFEAVSTLTLKSKMSEKAFAALVVPDGVSPSWGSGEAKLVCEVRGTLIVSGGNPVTGSAPRLMFDDFPTPPAGSSEDVYFFESHDVSAASWAKRKRGWWSTSFMQDESSICPPGRVSGEYVYGRFDHLASSKVLSSDLIYQLFRKFDISGDWWYSYSLSSRDSYINTSSSAYISSLSFKPASIVELLPQVTHPVKRLGPVEPLTDSAVAFCIPDGLRITLELFGTKNGGLYGDPSQEEDLVVYGTLHLKWSAKDHRCIFERWQGLLKADGSPVEEFGVPYDNQHARMGKNKINPVTSTSFRYRYYLFQGDVLYPFDGGELKNAIIRFACATGSEDNVEGEKGLFKSFGLYADVQRAFQACAKS
jgi:hypothetical protein